MADNGVHCAAHNKCYLTPDCRNWMVSSHEWLPVHNGCPSQSLFAFRSFRPDDPVLKAVDHLRAPDSGRNCPHRCRSHSRPAYGDGACDRTASILTRLVSRPGRSPAGAPVQTTWVEGSRAWRRFEIIFCHGHLRPDAHRYAFQVLASLLSEIAEIIKPRADDVIALVLLRCLVTPTSISLSPGPRR